MHLLVSQSGTLDDAEEPRDLGQTPGDIVVLSTADTELALLATAQANRLKARIAGTQTPSLRLANILHLKHNFSVDLFLEKTLVGARLVVVRLLGGQSYWPYGIERLAAAAREGRFALAVLPGDDKPDTALTAFSTVGVNFHTQLWTCLSEGGIANGERFLESAAAHLEGGLQPLPPRPILRTGRYDHPLTHPANDDSRPTAAVIFYRALYQSGDLAGIDTLIEALSNAGLSPLPIFVASLRDAASRATIEEIFAFNPPHVILNTTAFASTGPDDPLPGGPLAHYGVPVLQVVLSGGSQEAWQNSHAGLTARDVAMHVALPEIDGRILTRAVSFKVDATFDDATEHYVVRSAGHVERARAVATHAANWTQLRSTPRSNRKVALVLANYPNRDSRIANGVGLDTPESAARILKRLATEGYGIEGTPPDGNALIDELLLGPTNAGTKQREPTHTLSLDQYRALFEILPNEIRTAVTSQWGAPADDPMIQNGRFALACRTYGNAALAIQPARGYNIDPKATYHDPALVPPHNYFAFYFWLRDIFKAHAVVHLGKHGNLEWLPGKALALSQSCYPDAILDGLPNIYPFIVNDPGEGSQAKRRNAAVVIDHLTPPMTRAETYGELKDLEVLVDEYYQAAGLDEKRRAYLERSIVAISQRLGLDQDLGVHLQNDDESTTALQAIDAHLCDIKELQIRDGLHIFGQSPLDAPRRDTLIALARVPRGDSFDNPAHASLLRALSDDLGFGDFDPLACDLAETWTGPRPQHLQPISTSPWRTNGDTVERLECLAIALLDDKCSRPKAWVRTGAVLDWLTGTMAPHLDECGNAEWSGLLNALEGRFVSPGPSGAPTRGRPDVLPTGRNFYSLDSRTLPTPAAWELGRSSAELVVERYCQDHGQWPRALALSAWGTANMRTGGDDIAQAMALIGAKPTWEPASGRITGYEILTLAQLGRPRVDITFRMSGFFRDAFPAQITLLDNAIRAVAGLSEAGEDNPIAAAARADMADLIAQGTPEAVAKRQASARIFGSKPGAYGAGLQALIDSNIWQDGNELADAYLTWGQYAYGTELDGAPNRPLFEARLRTTDAILHNQDNREHDILDSDDYYQFAGGLAVATASLKGAPVKVYHNDHSRPERPVVRALEEEIGRVVRGRASNPKWIAGVMRHGYKGAFEIAATVDYLYAFAVTTTAVGDHHFDALFDAYLGNRDVLDFLEVNNRQALADITARFEDAMKRRLWTPRRNSAARILSDIQERASRPPTAAETAL